MGNCMFKGFGVVKIEEMVKVVTSNGGIMELYAPISADCITNEFPGHGLFRSPNRSSSSALLHNEELLAGHFYFLLPLNAGKPTEIDDDRIDSASSAGILAAAPYRMSIDNQRLLKRWDSAAVAAEAEVFPRYNSAGVWKVKLVISPEQLSEILTEDARTEALIESVRTVAKCGATSLSSAANSDGWSLSSI